MRKAVWSGVAAVAMLFACSSSAYAQLDTENITATVTVAARGRITLTGVIDFPDSDPFTNPTINAAGLTVQAMARIGPAATSTLTVRSGGDFTAAGGATIGIGNLSWATVGAGFNATGTMATTDTQVGQWTGPGSRTGTQTYTLVNSWNYAPGNYSATLTYTLTTP